ncbi:putative phage holin [Nocardiopsis synnemataformans]|uniref:putative phage holin n=1 Tax=Nocardiopsis synnemataformans TaxID=61305 RepID=UPI003EBE383B
MATLAALLLWLFAIDYSRWRWWVHPGGRLVMTVLVSLALVLTLVAARNWFGEFPGHSVARFVVFAAAFVAIGWAWLLHRRAQQGKHRAKR